MENEITWNEGLLGVLLEASRPDLAVWRDQDGTAQQEAA